VFITESIQRCSSRRSGGGAAWAAEPADSNKQAIKKIPYLFIKYKKNPFGAMKQLQGRSLFYAVLSPFFIVVWGAVFCGVWRIG
jgi:hypothetical protein